jgi:lysyl-tRNA synthetase class 2
MAGAIAQNIDTLGATEEVIHVAGRLMARREHGGAAFIHLQDESGTIQAHLRRDLLGVDAYTSFLSLTDIGDKDGRADRTSPFI